MDVESIRIISAIFSIIGSSLLAYRVTGILRALTIVANAHEGNINSLFSVHQNGERALIHRGNSTEHLIIRLRSSASTVLGSNQD